MVKLFTDEEMTEHCKDYRTIPLALRNDIFNIDNQNTELKLGFVTPVNINQYSISLSKFYGLDKMEYVKEYNKIYDKNTPNINIDEETPENITPEEAKPRRTRRRRIEIQEAKLMEQEDVRDEEIDKLRFGTAY